MARPKAKAKRDIYQEVTDKIIADLEAGTPSWLKPWKGGTVTDGSMPYNADTGRAYSGINVMLLWGAAQEYGHNGWVTYNQAKKRNAQVKKGEHGEMVTLFKPCTSKDKTTGEESNYFLLRSFTVFNVEQIDWSNPEAKPPAKYEPLLPPETHFTDLAKAVGCDVHIQGDRACYIPSADQVHMPHLDHFKSEAHFDATGYHELTHWTGHKTRMDRDLRNRFGDESYAFEELVAELGCAFLCAQTGTLNQEMRHHNSSYLASWLKVLKDDKKAIFTASSQARQANEWIIKQAGELIPTQKAA